MSFLSLFKKWFSRVNVTLVVLLHSGLESSGIPRVLNPFRFSATCFLCIIMSAKVANSALPFKKGDFQQLGTQSPPQSNRLPSVCLMGCQEVKRQVELTKAPLGLPVFTYVPTSAPVSKTSGSNFEATQPSPRNLLLQTSTCPSMEGKKSGKRKRNCKIWCRLCKNTFFYETG